MKKLLILLPALFIFTGCLFSDGAETKPLTFETSTGDHVYNVEIADNTDERSLGLMNRDSMPQDRGMIFIYSEEFKPAFWMKNTLIPLDMIFLNKDFVVVDFFENVPPCKEDPCPHYIPANNSQYIVELNAGQANKILLARGDKVIYN